MMSENKLFWVGGRDRDGVWQTATNLTWAQAQQAARILGLKNPKYESCEAPAWAVHRYTALGFPPNDIMVTATNVTAQQARALAHLTSMGRGYEFHPMHNIKNGVQARVHSSQLDLPGDHYHVRPYWMLNDANYTFAEWYPPEVYVTRREKRTGKYRERSEA
jgi:hypothetical protein